MWVVVGSGFQPGERSSLHRRPPLPRPRARRGSKNRTTAGMRLAPPLLSPLRCLRPGEHGPAAPLQLISGQEIQRRRPSPPCPKLVHHWRLHHVSVPSSSHPPRCLLRHRGLTPPVSGDIWMKGFAAAVLAGSGDGLAASSRRRQGTTASRCSKEAVATSGSKGRAVTGVKRQQAAMAVQFWSSIDPFFCKATDGSKSLGFLM